MKEDFHIDLSNKFYSKRTTGIAFVGTITKINKGCGISERVKRYIEKNLFNSLIHKDRAKLHAIYIYYIIKENLENIKRLIICNDEDFIIVKDSLIRLFKIDGILLNFEIINITEYREL